MCAKTLLVRVVVRPAISPAVERSPIIALTSCDKSWHENPYVAHGAQVAMQQWSQIWLLLSLTISICYLSSHQAENICASRSSTYEARSVVCSCVADGVTRVSDVRVDLVSMFGNARSCRRMSVSTTGSPPNFAAVERVIGSSIASMA